jgi:hypothetical protein
MLESAVAVSCQQEHLDALRYALCALLCPGV